MVNIFINEIPWKNLFDLVMILTIMSQVCTYNKKRVRDTLEIVKKTSSSESSQESSPPPPQKLQNIRLSDMLEILNTEKE